MFSAVAGGALGLLVQHALSGPECTAKDCFVLGSGLVFHIRLGANDQSYFLLLEFMTWFSTLGHLNAPSIRLQRICAFFPSLNLISF